MLLCSILCKIVKRFVTVQFISTQNINNLVLLNNFCAAIYSQEDPFEGPAPVDKDREKVYKRGSYLHKKEFRNAKLRGELKYDVILLLRYSTAQNEKPIHKPTHV